MTGGDALSTDAPLPTLPFREWEETKTTLHLFTQIVGKVRLALHPKLNHWWHAPLYVSARGLTTSAIPYRATNFEVDLDLIDHHLVLRSSEGEVLKVGLAGRSVGQFYRELFFSMGSLGIDAPILAKPFDPDRVKSKEPFATDETHAAYDGESAHRFWRALVSIDGIFKSFRGRFIGKSSPVHFFWHSFDLAVTRFSGRPAPVREDADPVTKEAYSHEVISAGFWPGDDNLPEPAFYSYVHPSPPGLEEEPLRPKAAWWQNQNGSSMALYRYEDFRTAPDPSADLLEFMQSAYEAGAKLSQWPREQLERRS